jgi:hypothetical protein
MHMNHFILFCSVLIKIQQLRFHLRPTFAVLFACGDENYYRMGTIKRKSDRSPLRHYTVDSIYGHYDLIEVKDQEPSFLLINNKCLIAQSSKKRHGSIDVSIENEQNQQFILALFAQCATFV